jgi:hypothetical protein
MSEFQRRLARPAAAILLPAYTAACFQYAPGRLEPPPAPRSEVKVYLSSPINVPLGELTLYDVRSIEGILSRSTPDSLQVFAKWLYPGLGRKYDAQGATFTLPRGEIASLDEYRFSTKLTVLAAAITGAVIVGFWQAIRLAKAGQGPPPSDGNQASVRGFGISF